MPQCVRLNSQRVCDSSGIARSLCAAFPPHPFAAVSLSCMVIRAQQEMKGASENVGRKQMSDVWLPKMKISIAVFIQLLVAGAASPGWPP